MKKIIKILLGFLLILTNVSAKSYYSEYSELSDFQDEEEWRVQVELDIVEKRCLMK